MCHTSPRIYFVLLKQSKQLSDGPVAPPLTLPFCACPGLFLTSRMPFLCPGGSTPLAGSTWPGDGAPPRP
eukprot:5494049-Pleurochrysis_carterae.AAC.1